MINSEYKKYIYSLSLQECKQLSDYIAGDDTAIFSTRISANSIPSDNEERNEFAQMLRWRIKTLDEYKNAYEDHVNQKYFSANKNYKSYFNSLEKNSPHDNIMQNSHNECLQQIRKIIIFRFLIFLMVITSGAISFYICDVLDKKKVVVIQEALDARNLELAKESYEKLYFKFQHNNLCKNIARLEYYYFLKKKLMTSYSKIKKTVDGLQQQLGCSIE